jgi:hypothetical protein
MSPRALGEGGESDMRSNQRQGGSGGRAHRGSSNGGSGGSQSGGCRGFTMAGGV